MSLGKRKRKASQLIPPKLMLTSMMDMFTIILIFLLFSFSSAPDSMKSMKDLELPGSSTEADFSDSIKIVLSSANLEINGEKMASVENEKIIGLDTENPKDCSFYRKLKALYDEQMLQDEGALKDRHVLFICDKHHSFKTINTVIKTAGLAGFPNFQLAVLEGKSE